MIIRAKAINNKILASLKTFLNSGVPIFSCITAFDTTAPAIAANKKPPASGIAYIKNEPNKDRTFEIVCIKLLMLLYLSVKIYDIIFETKRILFLVVQLLNDIF